MIEEIALKKKLTVDFLRKLGVSDGRKNSLCMKYYDKSGHKLTTRYRQEHEGKKPTYPIKPGTKLVPYGLWMLDKFNDDFLLIVEGESDCWTAWNTEISCLGIPGAQNDSCLSLDDVKQFSRLYVWQEPDARGNEFPVRIAGHLKALGYKGSIKSISHPEFKDISELHVAQHDEIETYRLIMDCIDQSKDIELKTWNEKKNVKPSPLHSSYKSRKPNKPLTEKLDEWVKTFNDETDSRTDKIFSWILNAFDSTTKHDIVERTFAAHPFIQRWFSNRDDRESDWSNIVKRAYDLWATLTFPPRNSPNLELELGSFNGGTGYGSKTLFYRADCKQAA